MHKISNRIFEIFFKKTLDFLLAGFRMNLPDMISIVNGQENNRIRKSRKSEHVRGGHTKSRSKRIFSCLCYPIFPLVLL